MSTRPYVLRISKALSVKTQCYVVGYKDKSLQIKNQPAKSSGCRFLFKPCYNLAKWCHTLNYLDLVWHVKNSVALYSIAMPPTVSTKWGGWGAWSAWEYKNKSHAFPPRVITFLPSYRPTFIYKTIYVKVIISSAEQRWYLYWNLCRGLLLRNMSSVFANKYRTL